MSFLPRALAHNWRLKLAALGLSVFLWALVQTEPRTAQSLPAPVLVEVADTGWTTVGAPEPASVELRITGPTGEIVDLAAEGALIRVPVASVGSSDTVITLRREWVALGEGTGLTVESLTPSTVRMSFEQALTRVLPVAMRTRGELDEDLALANPIGLNPQVVRVRGPASRVETLDSVRLQPLPLDEVDESGIYEVGVDTTGMGGARVTPMNASLGVRVGARFERALTEVPVQLPSPDDGTELAVEPSTIEVRLVGARTLVTTLDPQELAVTLSSESVQGMVVGEERSVPVLLQGVPELVIARPLPAIVTVRRAAEVQAEDDGSGPDGPGDSGS